MGHFVETCLFSSNYRREFLELFLDFYLNPLKIMNFSKFSKNFSKMFIAFSTTDI